MNFISISWEFEMLCPFFSCQTAKENGIWAQNVTISRWVISSTDVSEGYLQIELPE